MEECKPLGYGQRSGAAPPELLHMADDTQDAVSELLRELRPPELPALDAAAEARAAAAAAAEQARNLAAPGRVRGEAAGWGSRALHATSQDTI